MEIRFQVGPNVDEETGSRSQPGACLALLRAAYSTLTEAERRVADFILANSDIVLLLSITEVARRSQVGASTLTRLAVKLGFTGYPELRTALGVELLNRDDTAPEALTTEDDAAAVTRKVLQLGIQNLQDTIGLLDPNEVERASQALLRARRIHLYAVGPNTAALVLVAQSRLLQAGIGCAAFVNSYEVEMAADLLGPGDLAIGFSYTGQGRETVIALGAAQLHGATTVCVTNVPNSAVTKVADIRLLTAALEKPENEHPAASLLAMMAAIDILYARTLLLRHRLRQQLLAQPSTPDRDGAGSE